MATPKVAHAAMAAQAFAVQSQIHGSWAAKEGGMTVIFARDTVGRADRQDEAWLGSAVHRQQTSAMQARRGTPQHSPALSANTRRVRRLDSGTYQRRDIRLLASSRDSPARRAHPRRFGARLGAWRVRDRGGRRAARRERDHPHRRTSGEVGSELLYRADESRLASTLPARRGRSTPTGRFSAWRPRLAAFA